MRSAYQYIHSNIIYIYLLCCVCNLYLPLRTATIIKHTSQPVYKLSGSPGKMTPKIAGGLPDFSTWASARLLCFTTICTSIYGMDAHICWRTTRFIDMEIRRMPMFVFLIYTLFTTLGSCVTDIKLIGGMPFVLHSTCLSRPLHIILFRRAYLMTLVPRLKRSL